MPRFYFDIEDGDFSRDDRDGVELQSLDAAELEAATVAAEISHQHARAGKRGTVKVRVREEAGDLASTATSSLTVARRT